MHNFNFKNSEEKSHVLDTIRTWILNRNLEIESEDLVRPWGGFFLIKESSLPSFINLFYPDQKDSIDTDAKLSPKILVVTPKMRLSWQYHFRRSEIWKVLSGPVGVVMSDNDDEKETREFDEGDVIELSMSIRHRLIGMDQWGIIAEIWKHSDKKNPSDEDDIVRLQDDFKR